MEQAGAVDPELAAILAAEPVLVRRKAGRLTRALDYAANEGELKAVLPGVFVAAEAIVTWQLAGLAACEYADDAIITGPAAAALGFWPACKVPQVHAFHKHPVRARSPIMWHRHPVPAQWVVDRGPIRYGHPAWTAVDMCASDRSDVLDEALRAGVALATLWEAFGDMAGRRGSPIRRRLLNDSRDEPWSAAERMAHRLLREAGITGWRTNVRLGDYYLDIAWPAARVCLEVDGFEHHGGRAGFEADRLRDQVLASRGWIVIRVTWAQLSSDPDGFLRRLRAVLRRREALAAA